MAGVTYIVTLYNKARYIAGVLAAIAGQAGDFARQLIVVDDGSTDGSADIAADALASWPGARLICQANRGPSVAVNRGLAEAAQPFTYIVDGDDILAPYATRLLLGAAVKSGCGLVYGRSRWYETHADIAFPDAPEDVAVGILADTLYAVIRGGLAGGSTSLVATEPFQRVGGCDERVFIQDQGIPQRMAQVAKIGRIEHLVCMGPADDPERLMKRPAQLLHDQSLTALCTLRDHPDLPPRIRRLIQKQLTGRAWRWAARHDDASIFSRDFLRFLAARLPGIRLGERTLEATLAAFRRNTNIRLMPPR